MASVCSFRWLALAALMGILLGVSSASHVVYLHWSDTMELNTTAILLRTFAQTKDCDLYNVDLVRTTRVGDMIHTRVMATVSDGCDEEFTELQAALGHVVANFTFLARTRTRSGIHNGGKNTTLVAKTTQTFRTQDVLTRSWARDRINQVREPLDTDVSRPVGLTPMRTATLYTVDTGIRLDHDEFEGRASVIYDAYPSTFSVDDCNVHGTHVASIAAGKNVGMFPFANIYVARAIDCNGAGTTQTVLNAIFAIEDHCSTNSLRGIVVNLSIGGAGTIAGNLALANEFAILRQLCDANLIVAAGNAHTFACNYVPASFVNVDHGHTITVGATTITDGQATFSNIGPCVSIQAPGLNVIGADQSGSNSYIYLSGTSMASPVVAGVALAWMSQCTPGASPDTFCSDYTYYKIVNTTAARNVLNGIRSDTVNSLVQLTHTASDISGFVVPPFPHIADTYVPVTSGTDAIVRVSTWYLCLVIVFVYFSTEK